MPINPSLVPAYNVIPGNYNEPKTIGNWVDIYSNKNRFVVGQYLNEAILESGVVICALGKHPIHGYTRVGKPTAAGSKILGVSQTNPAAILTWDEATKTYQYPVNSNIPLATTGDIYMFSETVGEVGDKAYFRHTADGAKNRIGALSNVAGVGLELLPNSIYAESLSAPGIVAISLLLA